ncbi:MAG: SMC-Scp complex subunit ScpB [Aquihabitans sp.]
MATEASKAIEAILMVAQEPVDPHLLAQLLEVAPDRVSELCQELQAAYEAEDRGFVLVKVAGGYRFQSHGDMAAYVERFVLEGQTARLSSAALETLAIVAYKQPLSRAQVAAIRGVNVDGVMRTLQQRGYIDEVGRDSGPGQATLFGTTSEFLERLGLDSLHDLPPIADLFPSADVMEALERGLRASPVDPAESSGTSGSVPPEVDLTTTGASTVLPAGPPIDLEPPAWFVELESTETTFPNEHDPTDADPPGAVDLPDASQLPPVEAPDRHEDTVHPTNPPDQRFDES